MPAGLALLVTCRQEARGLGANGRGEKFSCCCDGLRSFMLKMAAR